MTQNNSDVIFVGNKPPMSYVLGNHHEPLCRKPKRNYLKSERTGYNDCC